MLTVTPRPIDREALAALLKDRASRHSNNRYFREVDRLVNVLVYLHGRPDEPKGLRELILQFPNNPELNRPESKSPMDRILRWMAGHGVVKRMYHGYRLCWVSEDEFGTRILDLLWGRKPE